MNSLTIATKFYLLSDEKQVEFYNAASGLSHIFTLSGQKFNKLKAKIDAGKHDLMSCYAFGTEARHFLEFAMLGVVGKRSLTGSQTSRIAYLCDGDTSKQVKDKSVSRTFERTNVIASNGQATTHKMGITNNLTTSLTLSRKILRK